MSIVTIVLVLILGVLLIYWAQRSPLGEPYNWAIMGVMIMLLAWFLLGGGKL